MPQDPLTASQRLRVLPVTKWLTKRVTGREQVLDILAGILAVPSRSAPKGRGQVDLKHITTLAAYRTSWRDALLDQLGTTLAKNSDTADLARRLRGYLEAAREHEADAAQRWTPETLNRLREWTAERLLEINRKRTDSKHRPLKITFGYLAGVFENARAELSEHHIKIRPAHWRPIVRDAWATERQGQQLTDAQADAIAVTPRGRIRAPKAMALQMLADLAGREDVGELKKDLSRVRVGPRAL